jgi:hypothetical protein
MTELTFLRTQGTDLVDERDPREAEARKPHRAVLMRHLLLAEPLR